MTYKFLPLRKVLQYEEEMKRQGVSVVARSPRGFLTAYRKEGAKGLSQEWLKKRRNFIARHLAQVRKRKEPLFVSGRPTRRHLALIAWAYSPAASRL